MKNDDLKDLLYSTSKQEVSEETQYGSLFSVD